NELDQEKYKIYLRGVKKEIKIYREENVSLLASLAEEGQQYSAITGQMSISYKGEKLTMPMAAKLFHSTDRAERETVYNLVKEERTSGNEKLDELFSKLLEKRNKVALNAGFRNYRDYMFAAMQRFDYTAEDCFSFHEGIEKAVVPLVTSLQEKRKEIMQLEDLKPWDTTVDESGKTMLKPFVGGEELITKSITAFYNINPYFGERLQIMKEMGYLDLESKEGKAPGGFNYPLYEIGVPFIYMNAVGSQSDLTTMVHEGGHAIHSFLTRDYKLTAFKSFPSEVAELASMSMELISMDEWSQFYSSEEDLRRAKIEQLHRAIDVLPWIAIVDKFQHWVYENPTHTVVERAEKWDEIFGQFSGSIIDWRGNETYRKNLWKKQGHIFEVPFYYIEYGMAQLGAIAVWRNYKENPEKAIQQYIDALSLGYTKSIGDIYEAAGIKFDFSYVYVKELMDFVKEELVKLEE
ncbi:MAG: M3 family oligoendopeptidase, partial [Methylococcales bacterium]|nr:M3 family oligoendopeptidase [Methylococcales bacterium]